jgi:hypothetical protein
MLYTDGIILTMQDLREHDNFVLEIASTEAIEISSKLAIAQREVGYELASFLKSRETPIALERVVVNDELRDLLALQTLAAVYTDAYNRHLNDRYLGRTKEFRLASERSFHRFLQNGVGIATSPVQRAQRPVVSPFDSGLLETGAYVVQIAWEHATGSIGERSDSLSFDCPGGGIVVTPSIPPVNMAGWHVYIGNADAEPKRQNQTTLAVSSTWTQAAALRSDLPGTDVSGPDYYVRQSSQMVRR